MPQSAASGLSSGRWSSSASMTHPRNGPRVAAEQSLTSEVGDYAAAAPAQLITPERAFYRVLEESKLYQLEVRPCGGDQAQAQAQGEGADVEVVAVHELRKRARRVSTRERERLNSGERDVSVYCVKKMPEEVVASCGRLLVAFGPSRRPTWLIQLAHVERAFMVLSAPDAARGIERILLERLPPTAEAIEESGRFYYRVLVPIEVRAMPDVLAPVISRHVMKNAEDIVEGSRVYRCPQSPVAFVKLAYEDGWLFDALHSGIKVLERLATEPTIELGQFFYVVRIPVGIRVAPNIMAQRAGKGYRLHSIVEGSQRFTPPGSKVTYVKVCREKNARCTCAQTHQSHDTGTSSPQKRAMTGQRLTEEDEDVLRPGSAAAGNLHSSSPPTSTSTCCSGWIFETTMDGQIVLEPIAKPAQRQIERLFYRVLEDVDVLSTPGQFLNSLLPPEKRQALPVSSSSRRKRLKDTLIECNERIVPGRTNDSQEATPPIPELAFVKLRHDVGWICERKLVAPYPMVLEQVQGFAVTRDQPKLYRVLVAVHLRSAPDFECPRVPGLAPLAVGSVFESSLQYTPPGSRITYIKLNNDSSLSSSTNTGGWLFDQTPSGDRVLEALNDDPEKKDGKFFFRVICDKKQVLLSPDGDGEIVKYLFRNECFAAELAYTLPRTQESFVRLAKEKGWVALDPPPNEESTPDPTLQRISEELYNLYIMPPSWISIGFPNRAWYKVPDEGCRTILIEETLLQNEIFQPRNILASSSQGRDEVPIVRRGTLSLGEGRSIWRVTLEEIKHPASPLLFTFPWKQLWWILENDTDERHCVELQHGLRGGFRAVFVDGKQLMQHRSVGDILWDSGSEMEFAWGNRTCKVVIALEGSFFSQYLQFYSYTLIVDGHMIVPIAF